MGFLFSVICDVEMVLYSYYILFNFQSANYTNYTQNTSHFRKSDDNSLWSFTELRRKEFDNGGEGFGKYGLGFALEEFHFDAGVEQGFAITYDSIDGESWYV